MYIGCIAMVRLPFVALANSSADVDFIPNPFYAKVIFHQFDWLGCMKSG